jgi:hypothetical protein
MCNAATSHCCIQAGGRGGVTQSCVPAAQACPGITLTCGVTNCPAGMTCCVPLSGRGGGVPPGVTSSCRATCPGGAGDNQLCNTTAMCPRGFTCQPNGLGFSVCD